MTHPTLIPVLRGNGLHLGVRRGGAEFQDLPGTTVVSSQGL